MNIKILSMCFSLKSIAKVKESHKGSIKKLK